MKHLIRKISSSKSKIHAHIKMGDDTINIISKTGSIRFIYNGYELFRCDKRASEKIVGMFRDISPYLCKEGCGSDVSVLQRPEDAVALEIVNTSIPAVFGDKKVIVGDIPDQGEGIKQTLSPVGEVSMAQECLVKNLGVLAKKITNVCKMLNALYQDSIMMTRKKLVDTMWGAKVMQGIIDSIKSEMCSDPRWQKIDIYSEMICKSIKRLQVKLSTDLKDVCQEEQRVIAEVLIPNIITNYEALKDLIIKAVMEAGILAHIDADFKKNTSYPANWFFDETMLKGIQQEYEFLLNFLCEIPKIEGRVIDPLDMIRLQFLS